MVGLVSVSPRRTRSRAVGLGDGAPPGWLQVKERDDESACHRFKCTLAHFSSGRPIQQPSFLQIRSSAVNLHMDSSQASTHSEEHRQTGMSKDYTQSGIEGKGSPTLSLNPEIPGTFTQPESLGFYDDANTYKASPDGPRDDSEQRDDMFPTYTDDGGDGTSMFWPPNQENIAPKTQKLTMMFTLGSSTTLTHTTSIHSGKELLVKFTLPARWGVITFDCTLRCEKCASTDWIPPPRRPLAPLSGIGERGGPPPHKRRRADSAENGRLSAAQEMSDAGGL